MKPGNRITQEFVADTLGEIEAEKMAAILATGATEEEFEEAARWAAGQHGVADEDLVHPLTGPGATIYDILVGDEFEED